MYSLNDDIAAERDAASGALDTYGAAESNYGAPEVTEARDNYDAPTLNDYEYETYDDAQAAESYAAPVEVREEPLPTYEEQPAYTGEEAGAVLEVREGRRFRGGRRQGRRQGGRRNGRRGGRRGGRNFRG